VVEPLAAAATDPPLPTLVFADRAVRAVLPLGLDAARLGAASRAVRELPAVLDAEAAKRTMIALEKVARAHAAPEQLIRGAHGVAACAVSLGLAAGRGGEATARAEGQLVSAIVRLVTATVRTGVPAEAVVAALDS
jgi:hypothetical protein